MDKQNQQLIKFLSYQWIQKHLGGFPFSIEKIIFSYPLKIFDTPFLTDCGTPMLKRVDNNIHVYGLMIDKISFERIIAITIIFPNIEQNIAWQYKIRDKIITEKIDENLLY